MGAAIIIHVQILLFSGHVTNFRAKEYFKAYKFANEASIALVGL